MDQFQPNMAQNILGWEGVRIQDNSKKGSRPSPRGENSKIVTFN